MSSKLERKLKRSLKTVLPSNIKSYHNSLILYPLYAAFFLIISFALFNLSTPNLHFNNDILANPVSIRSYSNTNVDVGNYPWTESKMDVYQYEQKDDKLVITVTDEDNIFYISLSKDHLVINDARSSKLGSNKVYLYEYNHIYGCLLQKEEYAVIIQSSSATKSQFISKIKQIMKENLK
ncbi:MAG: hypothetical protein RSB99_03985 [Bacilli bacterium]